MSLPACEKDDRCVRVLGSEILWTLMALACNYATLRAVLAQCHSSMKNVVLLCQTVHNRRVLGLVFGLVVLVIWYANCLQHLLSCTPPALSLWQTHCLPSRCAGGGSKASVRQHKRIRTKAECCISGGWFEGCASLAVPLSQLCTDCARCWLVHLCMQTVYNAQLTLLIMPPLPV